MPESAVDRLLVSRARDGDVDAFEQLARQCAPMVYRVALKTVGNRQDAQDVSQRALLSAWQGLRSFRGDAAFATWLHQITHRHALNSVARRTRPAWTGYGTDAQDAHNDPVEFVLGHDGAANVRAAVAALPVRERSVIELFHFEQFSYAQIAIATDSSEPAVRSRLFRARRSLAGALAGER